MGPSPGMLPDSSVQVTLPWSPKHQRPGGPSPIHPIRDSPEGPPCSNCAPASPSSHHNHHHSLSGCHRHSMCVSPQGARLAWDPAPGPVALGSALGWPRGPLGQGSGEDGSWDSTLGTLHCPERGWAQCSPPRAPPPNAHERLKGIQRCWGDTSCPPTPICHLDHLQTRAPLSPPSPPALRRSHRHRPSLRCRSSPAPPTLSPRTSAKPRPVSSPPPPLAGSHRPGLTRPPPRCRKRPRRPAPRRGAASPGAARPRPRPSRPRPAAHR